MIFFLYIFSVQKLVRRRGVAVMTQHRLPELMKMSKKGACLFIGLQESMVSLRVHCEIGILGSNQWTVYQAMEQLQVEKSLVDHIVYMCHIGYTLYHNSNLLWRSR